MFSCKCLVFVCPYSPVGFIIVPLHYTNYTSSGVFLSPCIPVYNTGAMAYANNYKSVLPTTTILIPSRSGSRYSLDMTVIEKITMDAGTATYVVLFWTAVVALTKWWSVFLWAPSYPLSEFWWSCIMNQASSHNAINFSFTTPCSLAASESLR